MSSRETLEDLEQFAEKSDLTLEVVAAGRKERGGSHELRMVSVADDAEELFLGTLRKATQNLIKRRLRKLDLQYKPEPDEVEWLEVGNVEAVNSTVERLRALSSSVSTFDPDDPTFKASMAYWAAVLTDDNSGEQAFFFRSFTASAELKRKPGIALVSKNGVFHRFEDHVFVFDRQVDCVVFRDKVFVLGKRNYRKIFDQVEKILQSARKAAKDLHERVPIHNFDEFQEACGSDSRMADKIIAVSKRSYFSDLKYQMVEPVIAEFDLGIEARDGRLVFDTSPSQRFKILRLVDDDYLKSVMTDFKYETNSKTQDI